MFDVAVANSAKTSEVSGVTPMRVAGKKLWSAKAMDVVNPYDGSLVGRVPVASVPEIVAAIEAMAGPIPRLTRHERASILRRIALQVEARKDELAMLASRESGLSLKDTGFEMLRAIDALNLAADATCFDDGAAYAGDIGANGKARRLVSHREPVGLVAAITPFNHPVNQVVAKVAPAIAAGAPIIVKPSEKTPLCALMLADMAYEAGLPGPMLSVITGDPRMIAHHFSIHPAVQLLTFTGSPAIGKELAASARYRRVVMELGGNDPLIVFPDADLDKAVSLALSGAYANSGQRCTAVKRILVHSSLADEFATRMAERSLKIVSGDPLDPLTEIGTVIDERSAIEIETRVRAACVEGARLITPFERKGALIRPCVLDHVPVTARLVHEETFGPVAPIIRFETIDQAIAISNGTAYGLSAGLCTDRLDWITRCISDLKVGGINVWEVPGYRSELSPFGGVKDSGLGQKEGMLEAVKLYTNIKTVSFPWF